MIMDNQLELLIELHKKLKDTFIRDYESKFQKSIYCSLLDLGSKNKRMRILQKSAVPAISLNSNHLEQLINQNYVEFIDKKEMFVSHLLVYGMWKMF